MVTSTRMWLAAGAFAAMLPCGMPGAAAAGMTAPATAGRAALVTDLDGTIDAFVRVQTAAGKLTAATAPVAREQLQLQFLAMPPEARAKVLAVAQRAAGDDDLRAVVRTMQRMVAEAAQQQADAARNAQLAAVKGSKQAASTMLQKLGTDGDLVFVATAGPCRVADTRLGIDADWPGMIGGFVARQIWAFSLYDGFDYASEQGGTGVAGSDNCLGTVFPTGFPASVVATVAVVNTTATGYLRAWNGGTTLTVGGILGWNAGDVLSNTTVIPLNRYIDAYPDSGPVKRDFAVYNNSGSAVDVVVDVVGYFVQNRATPLSCDHVAGRTLGLPAGATTSIHAPECPAGFTPIVAFAVAFSYGVDVGAATQTYCRFSNYTSVTESARCDVMCCRVPGR